MNNQIHSKGLTERTIQPGNTELSEITHITGASLVAMGYVFSSWKLAGVGAAIAIARLCVDINHQRQRDKNRSNNDPTCRLRVYRDDTRSSVR